MLRRHDALKLGVFWFYRLCAWGSNAKGFHKVVLKITLPCQATHGKKSTARGRWLNLAALTGSMGA